MHKCIIFGMFISNQLNKYFFNSEICRIFAMKSSKSRLNKTIETNIVKLYISQII